LGDAPPRVLSHHDSGCRRKTDDEGDHYKSAEDADEEGRLSLRIGWLTRPRVQSEGLHASLGRPVTRLSLEELSPPPFRKRSVRYALWEAVTLLQQRDGQKRSIPVREIVKPLPEPVTTQVTPSSLEVQ
jgi:hypothetical protein